MYLITDNERINKVCRLGKGKKTCSYLGMSADGMVCLKNGETQNAIDFRREMGMMKAMGDNCEGWSKREN